MYIGFKRLGAFSIHERRENYTKYIRLNTKLNTHHFIAWNNYDLSQILNKNYTKILFFPNNLEATEDSKIAHLFKLNFRAAFKALDTPLLPLKDNAILFNVKSSYFR